MVLREVDEFARRMIAVSRSLVSRTPKLSPVERRLFGARQPLRGKTTWRADFDAWVTAEQVRYDGLLVWADQLTFEGDSFGPMLHLALVEAARASW